VTRAANTDAARRARSEARTYDFRRPVRLAREHAHLLRVAMTTFERQSTTVLTTTLRALCHLASDRIEELSYDEFVSSLDDGTMCVVLSIEPWQGKALLTFPQTTLLTMVDHQLGGMGGENQPNRTLTDIEQALVRQLLQRLLRELAYALEPIAKGVHPQLLTLENDPRFVQAAAPTDPVVVAYFELAIGTTTSNVALCLPYPMLAPALEDHSRSNDQVDVSVRFDPMPMRSADIGALQVGDVVPLGHRTTAPLSVTSAASTFAKAVPGSSGKSLAILIVAAR
jgi:flagellar motor switch protein FliM